MAARFALAVVAGVAAVLALVAVISMSTGPNVLFSADEPNFMGADRLYSGSPSRDRFVMTDYTADPKVAAAAESLVATAEHGPSRHARRFPTSRQRRWAASARQHDARQRSRDSRSEEDKLRARWRHDQEIAHDNKLYAKVHSLERALRKARSQRSRWHRRISNDRRRLDAERRHHAHTHERIAHSRHVEHAKPKHAAKRAAHTAKRAAHTKLKIKKAGSESWYHNGAMAAVDDALAAHGNGISHDNDVEEKVADRLRRRGEKLRESADNARQAESKANEDAQEDDMEAHNDVTRAHELDQAAAGLLTQARFLAKSNSQALAQQKAEALKPAAAAQHALKKDAEKEREDHLKMANEAVRAQHLVAKNKVIGPALKAHMDELKAKLSQDHERTQQDRATLDNIEEPFTGVKASNKLAQVKSTTPHGIALSNSFKARALRHKATMLRKHAASLRAAAKKDKYTHKTLLRAARCLESHAHSLEDGADASNGTPHSMYLAALGRCGL